MTTNELVALLGNQPVGRVRHDRRARLTPQGRLTAAETGSVDWLDDTDIAERLRTLRADASAWRKTADTHPVVAKLAKFDYGARSSSRGRMRVHLGGGADIPPG